MREWRVRAEILLRDRGGDPWRGKGPRGDEKPYHVLPPLALSTDSATHLRIESAVKNPASNARLLLWVDAVGGFLVCQGNEIRLGQAVPGSPIELPLCWPICRAARHATIRRDEEGYTVEPLRVWLNDHQIDATVGSPMAACYSWGT